MKSRLKYSFLNLGVFNVIQHILNYFIELFHVHLEAASFHLQVTV